MAKLAAGAEWLRHPGPHGLRRQRHGPAGHAAELDQAQPGQYEEPQAGKTRSRPCPVRAIDSRCLTPSASRCWGSTKTRCGSTAFRPDPWAALFDPRYLAKIKGRVTVLDDQRELMGAALIYLGYSPNDTDPARRGEARDVILKAKPYWATFNASSHDVLLAAEGISWPRATAWTSIRQRQTQRKPAPASNRVRHSQGKRGGLIGRGQPGYTEDGPGAGACPAVHRLRARRPTVGGSEQRVGHRQPEQRCDGVHRSRRP